MDRVDLESTGSSNHARVLNRSYNGPDLTRRNASRALDRDPTVAVFDAFLNAYLRGFIRALHQRSDGCNLIETVHDEPFHQNRRLNLIGQLRPNAL